LPGSSCPVNSNEFMFSLLSRVLILNWYWIFDAEVYCLFGDDIL
jgi:hypothetical protein